MQVETTDTITDTALLREIINHLLIEREKLLTDCKTVKLSNTKLQRCLDTVREENVILRCELHNLQTEQRMGL
jgi:hypothetical protein